MTLQGDVMVDDFERNVILPGSLNLVCRDRLLVWKMWGGHGCPQILTFVYAENLIVASDGAGGRPYK